MLKMESYYVVQYWEECDTCDYVAGPFRFYHEVYDAKLEAVKNGGDYKIVSQITEVKET